MLIGIFYSKPSAFMLRIRRVMPMPPPERLKKSNSKYSFISAIVRVSPKRSNNFFLYPPSVIVLKRSSIMSRSVSRSADPNVSCPLRITSTLLAYPVSLLRFMFRRGWCIRGSQSKRMKGFHLLLCRAVLHVHVRVREHHIC